MDSTADGTQEAGNREFVPHKPSRPNKNSKAEHRRQEVADMCIPNHARVERHDDATWQCVSELACGNGSGCSG